MVELDDEMLLDDVLSPKEQNSPAGKSAGSLPEADNLLDELNYTETKPNPDGFFADADDQVSLPSHLNRINQLMRVSSPPGTILTTFDLELLSQSRRQSQAPRRPRTQGFGEEIVRHHPADPQQDLNWREDVPV